MKIDITHDFDASMGKALDELGTTIQESKKGLHATGAETLKEGVKENYDEAFQGAVNPGSTWQRLKKEMGFPSKPGHFTGSTLRSLMAQATEEAGEAFLSGKWPNPSITMQVGNSNVHITFTESGMHVTPFRSDKKGLRTGELFLPSEPFETKRYGAWINEDIGFMEITPEMEVRTAQGMQDFLDAEVDRALARLTSEKVNKATPKER